jgi:hypothetical protein
MLSTKVGVVAVFDMRVLLDGALPPQAVKNSATAMNTIIFFMIFLL